MDHLYPYPKMGHSFLEILHDPLTRQLVGYHDHQQAPETFIGGVHTRLAAITEDASKHLSILKIGYSALEAFLQSTCTGPPLDFDTEEVVIPPSLRPKSSETHSQLLRYLEVDGNAVYSLTPHVELFWLAKVCMSNESIAEAGFNGRRARIRVTFIHQKLLLEKSDALRDKIYSDAEILHNQLSSRLAFHGAAAEEHFVELLLERAAMRTYYADDQLAREDLLRAANTRQFQFALTGALGKRTKFQDRDISQLVVVARSRDHEPEPYSSRKSSRVDGIESRKSSQADHHAPTSDVALKPTPHSPTSQARQPDNLPLSDDTLLERIHFQPIPQADANLSKVAETTDLPPRLASLDLAKQPLLFPVDSIILLAVASATSNTSPSDSLTREETLPYATRVLEGGSSNWQVYTQALLVRSRIEGFKSRTAERGLLQLQALVDQVIAETSSSHGHTEPQATSSQSDQPVAPTTTFLPKPTASESASVAERLKYIYQISPPLRWELESELASRWVSMGGLKTALEIYERLQMYAEVALCLAATDQEPEAIKTLRRLLYQDEGSSQQEEDRLPLDAPRLFCILGDITQDPTHFERAWSVSNFRYARAQRSLGRYYTQRKKYTEALEAYKKSLAVNRLSASTWFALGCVQLELKDWEGAVESFARCVRENDDEAEAWSNLAVALLRLPEYGTEGNAVNIDAANHDDHVLDDTTFSVQQLSFLDSLASQQDTDNTEEDAGESTEEATKSLSQINTASPTSSLPQPTTSTKAPRNTLAALNALKQAARLKPNDARIWDNYLTVSASIPPPHTPWRDIILAQRRIVEIRGKSDGEKCIDDKILSALVQHVITTYAYPTSDSDPEAAESQAPQTASEATAPTSSSAAAAAAPDPKSKQQEKEPRVTSYRYRNSVPHLLSTLMDISITPLLTSNVTLYHLLSALNRWRRRPAAALAAQEKAWRIATSAPDAYETETSWERVVEETVELVGAYEEFGGMGREGVGGGWVRVLGVGEGRFKARSAVRGVMGRAKGNWEGTRPWGRLVDVLEGLKGS